MARWVVSTPPSTPPRRRGHMFVWIFDWYIGDLHEAFAIVHHVCDEILKRGIGIVNVRTDNHYHCMSPWFSVYM